MEMIVELHCHTTASDGFANPEQVVKHAKNIGLEAIAITDHNTIAGLSQARKAAKKLDMQLIPGVEVSTNKGHVLVLGQEELPPKNFEDLIDFSRDRSAVTIAAHPFGCFFRPGVIGEELEKVDSVEVLNGRTFSWNNSKALKLARKNKKPMASGSDAHLLREIGKYSCNIDADVLDGLLSAIKKGKVEFPMKKTSTKKIFWYALLTKKNKIIRKIS